LTIVFDLAKAYHPSDVSQPSRYAANIMLARDVSNLTDEEIDDFRNRLRFVDSATLDIRKLQCVLEVSQDLSHSGDGREPTDPDAQLDNFLLPVHTLLPYDGELLRQNFIPGPALSFAQRAPYRYAAQDQVRTEIDASNMTHSARSELKRISVIAHRLPCAKLHLSSNI
jgi:hypothetical protein